MAAGERDLEVLLSSLEPVLLPGTYVYAAVQEVTAPLLAAAKAVIREEEGVSLVVERAFADEHGLQYDSTFKWISISVHSSLEAVGLTAAMATALAAVPNPCSANVLAGLYHDHLLVPARDAEIALDKLQRLASDAKSRSSR